MQICPKYAQHILTGQFETPPRIMVKLKMGTFALQNGLLYTILKKGLWNLQSNGWNSKSKLKVAGQFSSVGGLR